MAELQTQRIKPAYGGWNTEAAPDYLGDVQAPVVENLLCRPGKLVMRGPITTSLDLGYGTTNQVAHGWQVFDDRILMCNSHPVGGFTTKHINVTSGVVTAVGATPANQQFFKGSSAQIGGFTYSFQNAGTLQLMRWDGTAVNPTPIAVAVAPSSGTDLIAHAERLFVGGSVVGGVGGDHTIHFSDVGGPAALALTDWQDDVTGLTNQIIVGSIVDSDDIFVGFGRAGRDLVIFKTRSVWVLTGTGAASFAVRRFSDTVGCVDSSTIESVNDVCYFLSDQGLMMFDGARIISVSDDIRTTMLGAVLNPTTGAAASNLHCKYISRSMLMMNATGQSHNGAVVTSVGQLSALFDTNTRTWTSFLTNGTTLPPCALIRCFGKTFVFDSRNLYRVDSIAQPSSDTLRTPADGKDVIMGTTAAIPARFYSRLVKLASPPERSQLHRLLIDYKFRFATGTDSTTGDAWTVALVAGDGTTLTTYQVPGQGSTTAYLYRRRDSQEIFQECVDYQLRVSWLGAATSLISAEIYDATVEFQSSHQRARA